MAKTKDQVLASVMANMNVPGLVEDLLDEVLRDALKEVVADTQNTLDDSILEVAYPLITPILKRRLQEKWDELKSDIDERVADSEIA